VRQLDPGDVGKYVVVRVADEVVVDLMRSAGGIEYAEASREIVRARGRWRPHPLRLAATALADEAAHASRERPARLAIPSAAF
jgi:hypothetical protein